jgi:hypothetical protein
MPFHKDQGDTLAEPSLLASYAPGHVWHFGQLVASVRNFANPGGISKAASSHVGSGTWMPHQHWQNWDQVRSKHGWRGCCVGKAFKLCPAYTLEPDKRCASVAEDEHRDTVLHRPADHTCGIWREHVTSTACDRSQTRLQQKGARHQKRSAFETSQTFAHCPCCHKGSSVGDVGHSAGLVSTDEVRGAHSQLQSCEHECRHHSERGTSFPDSSAMIWSLAAQNAFC